MGDVGRPSDLVMRDLVDTMVQERLCVVRVAAAPPRAGATLQPGELWCRIDLAGGWVCFRGRPAGALQPYRFSRPPLWHGGTSRRLAPDELLELLAADLPHASGVGADLRTAVAHAAVLCGMRARWGSARLRPGELLGGERLTATRNRPFHPTARAAVGWSAAELARYGPLRRQPLGLAWVAVRRERLRLGSGPDSGRLPELLLDQADRQRLVEAVGRAGLGLGEVTLLPVHPWQLDHVLPAVFGAELAAGEVVSLVRRLRPLRLGRFHPTASLRTLATAPETALHVKLPLGISTLGAARLLPPRYLDNGERAQATMQALLDRDPVLRARVRLCDERSWCGWGDPSGADELDDRGGQLAAQLRAYPAGLVGDPTTLLLPMAALAAHEWAVLGPALGGAGFHPVELFRRLATAFCELGLGFLRYGVLPELHGQNVVAVLRGGEATAFVLRDHDTLRLYPEWLAAEGVTDPGYRIRPGAAQSLRLRSAEALLGYLQTLGFQVNLYGIADALVRHYGLDERVLWGELRGAVLDALGRLALPGRVAEVVERELLHAPSWPSRLVLGPLLRQGRSDSVSMPAGEGRVPNPLARLAGPQVPQTPATARPTTANPGGAGPRQIAERASRQRLLNAFLRETAVPVAVAEGRLRVPLAMSGCSLLVELRSWSILGHHAYGDELAVQRDGGSSMPAGHGELVALLLTELEAVAARMIDCVSQPRPRCAELTAAIEDSVARTTHYLERDPRPRPADPRSRTRRAEQSLRFGHPFHPTPKGAQGLRAEDLAAYAPELGASFPLHWVAVAPELLVEDRLWDAPWVPPEVVEQAAGLLGPASVGHPLLPVHPWQAGYLRRQPRFRALVADGGLVPLGALGRPGYPTSSVRTVCDPAFATSWKLPLHVRITNFVRTNPPEHARRAADGSRLLAALRGGWAHDGFEVLVETGYRGVADPALAPDLTVVYRENPFATRDEAPLVVASLLEDGPDGAAPELVQDIRATGGQVTDWLRRYLEISLVPLLAVFSRDGVSLEAHVQNSLLHLDGGWPARFFVRDMEGISVSRQRAADLLPAASPARYDDAEAWQRLKYYLVTNHLGHLIAVLARHTEVGEPRLWREVREVLRRLPPDRYVVDLLTSPVLPAKANLVSRVAGRGERPLYVDIPNPLAEL